MIIRMTENLQDRQQLEIERIEDEYEKIQDKFSERQLSIICIILMNE